MGRKVGPRVCLMDVESTGLEADIGRVVGIGLMEEDGKFRWFYSATPKEEARTIRSALEALARYHILLTWSGKGFDLPFLKARALKLKLRVEELLKPTHVDLAEFVRSNLRLARSDLYHVAKFLGIRKDLSVEGMDVPALYLRALNGDRRAASAIKRHCRDDLEVTRRIYLKLLPLLKVQMPELAL